MPILEKVKTVSVEEPFQIPNTDIKIWKVKLELPDGERCLYSTMSKHIANTDFSGDVETYVNDKGKEYIRQPKKESTQGYQKSPETEENIARAVALKAAVEYYNLADTSPTSKNWASQERVLETADTFLAWLKGEAVEQENKAEEEKPDSQWDEPVFDPDTGERIM